MQSFTEMGVGSIILTSGTLSPLGSFAQELKLDFPVQLENPHVISSNQIWAGVVSLGPSGHPFNSSFRNRDSPEYKQELGNAVVNFARIVPDGLLVFFPSYYLLDQCISFWKNMGNTNSSTIWERICKFKKPVIEPRQASLFPLAIEDYMTKLKDTSTSGAVFFSVCRGKVSEGLDFADHAGRAVVITGMPFATRTDPKVRLKREYLDLQAQSPGVGCKMLKLLTGEDWYNQQASRAVNQSIGRVIRHRHDYGAIIFCDERFAQPNRQSQISAWIQPHIKCYTKFGNAVFTLTHFFRDGESRGHAKPEPEVAYHKGIDLSPCSTASAPDEGIKESSSGNRAEIQTAQPLDKSFRRKLPSWSTSMAIPHSNDKPSSLLEVKSNNTSHLRDILPANLSCFTPCMDLKRLKRPSDLMIKEKKLLITGKGKMQYQNHDNIDLTGDLSLEKQQSKEKQPVPCSMKKHKVQLTEHNSSPSVNASAAQRLGPRDPPVTDAGAAEVDTKFLEHKNSDVRLSAEQRGAVETKGSAFLIQVKEKLSPAEYKQFVGYMREMKSKVIKIDNLLQCIVGLFSGPERLPLLERFKDYVPARHHSLYEQYIETSRRDA
ncbi:heat shock 70 kDa protein 14-like [Hibiscus syriacus]|uniref:Regulator of telomere elongation helicase 1 homolog n=1 Tax=Hibiscus syriacus TaxID=106335 RepID=A0A6A3C5E8_HIBSY|nr:heat shock 70 kDa protein 14-like [Hibiscus syriacus]